MKCISSMMQQAKRQAEFYEQVVTCALHYIAENEGSITDFLDNYNLYEDWYSMDCNEFFGFDEYEEPIDDCEKPDEE